MAATIVPLLLVLRRDETTLLIPNVLEVALASSVAPESVVDASVVEESDELVPKTSAPLPVSSVMSEASSAEVSIEVEDILLVKDVQSAARRKPLVEPDAA